MAEDYEFDFIYCPECGGNIRIHGLFTTGIVVCAGKMGICCDCGKEWHVIWENCSDYQEE